MPTNLGVYLENIVIALLSAFGCVGFQLSTALVLLFATVAYAQPVDDQYGSPVDPVGTATETLGVLPGTGGPLLFIVGGVLVVVGAGLAVRPRIDGSW